MNWKTRKERQMWRFFAFSFLLHLCSALLFTAYADRVLNIYRQKVFYLDLNQMSLPPVAVSGEKPRPVTVKKPQTTAIPAAPVKAVQPEVPVAPPSPPMSQTVASETASPEPVATSEPVSTGLQGNTGSSTVTAAAPQAALSSSSGAQGEGTGPVGEVTFGSASGPSFLQRVLPKYPTVARRFNREGKVILRLTINAGGSLLDVEVLEDPGYGFAAAAVDAVRKSRFFPARHAGRPFTAKAILPIRFTLQGVN